MYETTYTFGVETKLNFAEARARVEQLLKEAGFGILTEIDVRETMKKKLDVEFRPYLILGACNPAIAYEAFRYELEIGALLPCNVILYAKEDGGTNVAFMDPLAAMDLTGNPSLKEAATRVRELLAGVAQRIAS